MAPDGMDYDHGSGDDSRHDENRQKGCPAPLVGRAKPEHAGDRRSDVDHQDMRRRDEAPESWIEQPTRTERTRRGR